MKQHFSAGMIEKLDDHIILTVLDTDQEISKEVVDQMSNTKNSLIGNNRYGNIVDISKGFINVSEKVKMYTAVDPIINKNKIANAVIVENFGQRLWVDLCVKLYKPTVPTKAFSNLTSAKNWIKKY